MILSITQSGQLWSVRFPYDADVVTACKMLNGHWHATDKAWKFARAEDVDLLRGESVFATSGADLLQRVRARKIERAGFRIDPSLPLSPDGLSLLPFQVDAVKFIAQRESSLLAFPMGTGKSIISVGTLNAAPDAKRILIICPANLKSNWYAELKKWLRDDRTVGIVSGSYWPPTNVVIINYDVLDRHKDAIDDVLWDICLIDECFPAGTMIATPDGDRAIEDLVAGDSVLNATGIGTVTAIGQRNTIELVELEFSDGTITRCTGNHPFFTIDGWTPASRLELGGVAFRREDVSDLLSGVPARSQSGEGWGGPRSVQTSVGQASLLQSILLEEIEEPNSLSGCAGELVAAAQGDWSSAQGSWWEWEAAARGAAYPAGGSWLSVGGGTADPHEGPEGRGLPDLLQGGLGEPGDDDSNRSGRWLPRLYGAAGAGRQEERLSSVVRLVRRSSVKLGGPAAVFNLQVSGHPSYYANGHLVHNCHYAKSPRAIRTKALIGGKKGQKIWQPIRAHRKIALSGTPLVNKPMEIWAVLNWLDPKNWPSSYWFGKKYAGGHQGPFGWVADGATNLEDLNRRLRSTVMLRKTKAELLPDLPPKYRQVIEFDLPSIGSIIRAEQSAVESARAGVADLQAAVVMARVNKDEGEYREAVNRLKAYMRQAQSHIARARKNLAVAKVPYVVDHLRNALLDPDKKIIVFAHHRAVIESLFNQLTALKMQPVRLYGGMTQEDKNKAVETFQLDRNCRVFIGSITAAGVGLTLTAADHVVFAELDYVPGNMGQCEDRAWRLGAKSAVLVQHLVASGSLDAKIAKRLIEKQEILDAVLDGTSPLDALAPINWLLDHEEDADLSSAITEDALSRPVKPQEIAPAIYGLRSLVDRPRDFGVSDVDLILASRLVGRPLEGRPAAMARHLMKKYLDRS